MPAFLPYDICDVNWLRNTAAICTSQKKLLTYS